MFHDADFAIVVVPLMFAMMVGMGLMMWFMMKDMMMSGHDNSHGPSNSREAQTARGMAFLRSRIASLEDDVASLQRELEATRNGPTSAGRSRDASSKNLSSR